MPELMTYLGWVANGLLILGAWGIAYKVRVSLLIGALGGFLWAAKAVYTGQTDLLAIEIILSSIQVWSFIKWGKST